MKTKTQNTNSGLKSRSEQLSTEKRGQISFAKRRENRLLNTESLLAVLKIEAPRLFELAEVVGKWVWIHFSEKQTSEVTSVLSELGFHWNNTRQSWQHPCGLIRKGTPIDPRRKYANYFAADIKPT